MNRRERVGGWLLRAVLGPLLVAGILYWGWCWGWWGRGNLWLRAAFQCQCPRASEAARYRPFKVLVSACVEPSLQSFSPNGRYVTVVERVPRSRTVRIDLQTGQRLVTALGGGSSYFLDDTLLLGRLSLKEKDALLLDLSDGRVTSVPFVDIARYDVSQEAVLEVLRQAERVVAMRGGAFPWLIVGLATDYRQHPDKTIVIYGNSGFLQTLADEGISHTEVPPPYVDGPSPDYHRYSLKRQFWADSDGIYLAQTEQRIVTTPPDAPGPAGWVLNDQAVVYGYGEYAFLIETDVFGDHFPVPQPILLLEVPPGYWATPTPAP